MLEIKCPLSKRANTVCTEATADNSFYLECKNGKYTLKKNHSSGYFAQVQGQLATTGLQWCDICVFFSQSNELCVDRIYFETHYWFNELLPKLSNFYFTYALPFVMPQDLASATEQNYIDSKDLTPEL